MDVDGAHVYLTRYGIKNDDESWYERRLPLFERFYLGSLWAQTNSRWCAILLVDQLIPRKSLDALNKLVAHDERFIISEKWDHITGGIYTRFDSDDAVASDFTEKVYQHAEPGKLLNFNTGYYWHKDQIYLKESYPNNMFLSVWDDRGPYVDQHTRMWKHFDPVSVKGTPMWVHSYHNDTITAERKRKKPFGKRDIVQGEDVDYARFPCLDTTAQQS